MNFTDAGWICYGVWMDCFEFIEFGLDFGWILDGFFGMSMMFDGFAMEFCFLKNNFTDYGWIWGGCWTDLFGISWIFNGLVPCGAFGALKFPSRCSQSFKIHFGMLSVAFEGSKWIDFNI